MHASPDACIRLVWASKERRRRIFCANIRGRKNLFAILSNKIGIDDSDLQRLDRQLPGTLFAPHLLLKLYRFDWRGPDFAFLWHSNILIMSFPVFSMHAWPFVIPNVCRKQSGVACRPSSIQAMSSIHEVNYFELCMLHSSCNFVLRSVWSCLPESSFAPICICGFNWRRCSRELSQLAEGWQGHVHVGVI